MPTPGHLKAPWRKLKAAGSAAGRLEERSLSLGSLREGCPDLPGGSESRFSPCLSVTDGAPEGLLWPTDIPICHPQPAITQLLHSIPAQQLLVCGHTEGAQAPVQRKSGNQVL